MARATGTIAPGTAGACGVSLLELSGSNSVSTSEVGGLLNKGGLSGKRFQEAALLRSATKDLSHKEAQKAQKLIRHSFVLFVLLCGY